MRRRSDTTKSYEEVTDRAIHPASMRLGLASPARSWHDMMKWPEMHGSVGLILFFFSCPSLVIPRTYCVRGF